MNTEITIPPIALKLETFEITNKETMEQAVHLLSLGNRELDKLTADREKLTKPMNDALKEIRSRYKPAESRLESGIAFLRKLISSYQTDQKALALAKATKIAARVGKGTLKAETAIDKISALATPDERVATGAGSVSFRTVRKFELTNLALVPLEYHELSEAKIKTALKLGVEVPGVRYFDEEVPINRR